MKLAKTALQGLYKCMHLWKDKSYNVMILWRQNGKYSVIDLCVPLLSNLFLLLSSFNTEDLVLYTCRLMKPIYLRKSNINLHESYGRYT